MSFIKKIKHTLNPFNFEHFEDKGASTTLSTKLEVGYSPEFKKGIDNLTEELKKATDIITKYNQSRGANGLLAALQAEAANNAEPELKQLGQWVFEGCDPIWTHAAIDSNGSAYRYTARPRAEITDQWVIDPPNTYTKIDGNFDPSDWRNSVIARDVVNDVDFDDDDAKALESEFLGNDPATGTSVDWFGFIDDGAPSLTEEDLQHIFIQNLTTVLIQRMHSLDRFSGEDKAITSLYIKSWDAVYVIETKQDGETECFYDYAVDYFNHDVTKNDRSISARTIYETEIDDWRQAMEERYAPSS